MAQEGRGCGWPLGVLEVFLSVVVVVVFVLHLRPSYPTGVLPEPAMINTVCVCMYVCINYFHRAPGEALILFSFYELELALRLYTRTMYYIACFLVLPS